MRVLDVVLKPKAKVIDFIHAHSFNYGFIISEKARAIIEKFKLDKYASFIEMKVYHLENIYKYFFFFTPYIDKYIDFEKSILNKATYSNSSIINLGTGWAKDKLNEIDLKGSEKIYLNPVAFEKNIPLPDFFATNTPVILKMKKRTFHSNKHFISERLKDVFEIEKITGIHFEEIPQSELK